MPVAYTRLPGYSAPIVDFYACTCDVCVAPANHVRQTNALYGKPTAEARCADHPLNIVLAPEREDEPLSNDALPPGLFWIDS